MFKFLLINLVLLGSIIQGGEAIKCFKGKHSSAAEACDTVNDKVDEVGDGFHTKVWTPLKSVINHKNWINKVGGWLKDNVGIDLTSHEDTKKWIKNVVNKLGVNVDTAGNCYIIYDKNGFEVDERECGAFGEIGKVGSQVVDWLQGGDMNLKRLWETSACFTKPGDKDKEICICNQDNCNKDVKTARRISGISESAKASMCSGKECPLVNLNQIEDEIDFNSACYTTTGDSTEKCFSTDILSRPQLAKLTRARRSTGEFQLTNIDGEANNDRETPSSHVNSGAVKTVWISVMFFCVATVLLNL